jgi:predicted methyltransferase
MGNFKPGFWVRTEETQRNYRNSSSKHQSAYIYAETYRKLIPLIKEYLPLSLDGEISIHRSRRGEWGEWFEVWRMVNGKPTIIKQGWQ